MNYISLETLMNDIRDSINLLSKHNFDLVVGIPRSGMIPAYLISLYLNIDVTDVNSFILNTPIQRGSTRTSGKRIYNPHDAQRILLVDDSFSTGKSMRNILDSIPVDLKKNIKTMVAYTSDVNGAGLDIYIRHVSHPDCLNGIYSITASLAIAVSILMVFYVSILMSFRMTMVKTI